MDPKRDESASGRTKILGIEFVPTNLPWNRRIEMISVLVWFFMFIVFPMNSYFLGLPILILLQFTPFGVIALVLVSSYFLWMLWFDKDAPDKGARRSHFVRQWSLWKRFNEYFPLKLVKTADLDPNKNYLFGAHPHGLLCIGVFGCFGTDGNSAKEIFPGFDFSILTFSTSFIFPLVRDILLWLGICSASRQSMNHLLSKEGGGNIAILIPGGAPEALDFCPGSYILQLKKRKGFIKVALQNGSPLVPVFAFGEHEVLDQVPNPRGSFLRWWQDFTQRIFNVPPVLFYGRGVFQYTLGFLPKRKPITVVVGAPIPVEKASQPSQTQIDELHKKYVDGLTQLFYDHKELYSPNDVLTIT